tara:strand:- start:13643 stop:14404 length:762 start_codon:yes stop_codon:yes gene_type:complete
MKKFIFILFFFYSIEINGREFGQTEITAEDGVEVFQDERYYLLKKNVQIESDNFILSGNLIKIYFDKDLYDIKIIDAKGDVNLNSNLHNIIAKGEELYFIIDEEKIMINGINSYLATDSIKMFSDEKIHVNNTNGDFNLFGDNSSIKTKDILVKGKEIYGVFEPNSNINDISLLTVEDKKIAYVMSNDTEMFANKIKYNKKTSVIELEENVKIIDQGEVVTGDFGSINTNTNSYKIKSKESKRVKVIISENNE